MNNESNEEQNPQSHQSNQEGSRYKVYEVSDSYKNEQDTPNPHKQMGPEFDPDGLGTVESDDNRLSINAKFSSTDRKLRPA